MKTMYDLNALPPEMRDEILGVTRLEGYVDIAMFLLWLSSHILMFMGVKYFPLDTGSYWTACGLMSAFLGCMLALFDMMVFHVLKKILYPKYSIAFAMLDD